MTIQNFYRYDGPDSDDPMMRRKHLYLSNGIKAMGFYHLLNSFSDQDNHIMLNRLLIHTPIQEHHLNLTAQTINTFTHTHT